MCRGIVKFSCLAVVVGLVVVADAAAGAGVGPTSTPPGLAKLQAKPTQFNGNFYGDYAGIAVTDHTAYPLWSDTRPVDLFLCPGTGTPTTPPAVCEAGALNASVANDEDIYTTAVPVG